MAVSADYLTYLVDQLASFARIRTRRMFGGVGLYADETFFALVADDTLYFKVDDSNRADYLARKCEPFRPLARDPDAYSMSYFTVPPEIIEDGDELKLWARKAYAAAASAQLVKAVRKAAKKRATKRPAKRIR
ncbi:MAG: TfoX/Sxy family protein [Steroidobacteraceae bacterium]